MTDLPAVARVVDADDLFVLQRVDEDQFVNLAGVGRGEGWAGNITVSPDTDPWLFEAPTGRAPLRYEGGMRRLFGPFWSTEAALVTVGEFAIVLSGRGVCGHSDDELLDAAGQVAWAVGEVPTEKRLADELELSQASLAVASIDAADRMTAARQLAAHAGELLGCEFTALLLCGDPLELVMAPDSWRPDADDQAIATAIAAFAAEQHGSDVFVDQEVQPSPLAMRPLALDDGLVARCLVPLGDEGRTGWLFCAHTVEQPRGFTSLCQRVAQAIGDHGTQVLARAA